MTSGLEGVVVAKTILCRIDGELGHLEYRGTPVEELAGKATFEQVAERLWHGFTTPGSLGRARATIPSLPVLAGRDPIEGLRIGLQTLRLRSHFEIAGAIPVVLASALGSHVAPDPELGTAADFLRMLRGRRASPEEETAFDTYLVTIAEHGMNASTFAARVVASTGAGMLPSVIAALCALQGPLHGGAPGPVLDMLDAIGSPDHIRPWLQDELQAGRRLMGFGHRIYRGPDPRAAILRDVVSALRPTPRLDFAREVEREALALLRERHPERSLPTNVEFYTALLLEALGIPREAFTCIFAMGRIAGWCAHVLEQQKSKRIFRPIAEYVGGGTA